MCRKWKRQKEKGRLRLTGRGKTKRETERLTERYIKTERQK